jgi:ATP-dependent Zn protease
MSKKVGLISMQQEQGYQKAISDETNYEIDLEIKAVVDECTARTRQLLQEK